MARIVSVNNNWNIDFSPVEMSCIRWLKISEALSRLGHQVDIAVSNTASGQRWWRKASSVSMGPNLSRVPLSSVRWSDYDVVKTSHNVGFETLERFGGQHHPFIISSLASVVAPEQMDGIYFYGKIRERLYATQEQVNRTSKYVSLRGQPAADLWKACFGRTENVLIVPGAADSQVPPPSTDPFPKDGRPRCIFAGNIYTKHTQPEAHRALVDKLNRLGKHLSGHGARLYMFGVGDARHLDKQHVTYLGIIPYEKTWDYLYFADVGCVVAYGSWLHNNESTKIYSYLRVGLPVVSEAGFPNDHILGEARLGFTVENGNMELMADKIVQASQTDWDRNYAIQYILRNHTWDKRIQAYDDLIRRELGSSRASG
jgi:glycosyltransferase involved in cell wall biosynthesis